MLRNHFYLVWFLLIGLIGCSTQTEKATIVEEIPLKDRLIVRADSFEISSEYVAPPGDALAHHTAGFAKIMCSAVFITGLDPDFAAENVGYFASPYEHRSKVSKPIIDRDNKAVHIDLPDGTRRTAIYTGDQGCGCLPLETKELSYEPKSITRNLPEASTTLWPMGDDTQNQPFPTELNQKKIMEAVDAAFANPEGLTAAFIVTWKGQINR